MAAPIEALRHALSDRYRVEHEIGRGGMATVYLADDLKHRRKVALKVLHPDRAAAIGQDRFLREIEIAARLTHPHILPLHDSGAADGQLYYVTPYIPGGSLRNKLEREKQLPLEDALQIVREIASALGHAHNEGLVHRDIKPENILISDGIALVADFGIARAMSAADHHLTTGSAVIGTPRYMAPEQVTGSPDVDGRADLYALGCVLYEMLAGQPPFNGPDESLAYQHLSIEPRLISELRPTVPRPVAVTIAKALAKLPSDRHSTAARFAEALVSAVTVASTPTPQPESESGSIPSNLPRQRTHFIGRERELAECARLLGDTRVLTITGIGGCGKTRLGVRLAESLLETFRDGVWYADLAPVKEADRVALTLATALGIREEPETPLLTTLSRHMSDRRAMVVLDNCEHVLQAASELVDALIAASGDLKVIVTSREGLGIEGERLFALRSLSLPAVGAAGSAELEASEAVRLFVDRAQALDARFALTDKTAGPVAEICRRLDGIPLAIELAAARIKVLSVADISARLDDRFRLLTGGSRTALPRHQTLRATIQWSFDQLTEDEQRLFVRLSVFAGGWTLAAAARVAAENQDEFEVLDLMTRLVDKSLVTMERDVEGETRYAMLETVRQYALERLNESGDGDVVRARHLQFYLELVEQAEPKLSSPEQLKWGSRLLQEQENLLAAHAWCDRDSSHAEEGLRLVGAIRRFWSLNGMFELGRRVTAEALARPEASRRTVARAKALNVASNLSYFLGRYQDARDWSGEALAIARDVGSEANMCDAHRILGMTSMVQGDSQAAGSHMNESIALARGLDDPTRLQNGLNALAEAYRSDGNLDAAEPLYQECLIMVRKQGDRVNLAISVSNLALVAMARGAFDRAGQFLAEGVNTVGARAIRNIWVLVDCISAYCAARGDWRLAARLHGAAETLRMKVGTFREHADEVVLAPLMDRARASLGEAEFLVAAAEGHALSIEDMLNEAREALKTPPSA
jgi:non-specific serine/threonine protein kinase